jgi:predicted RNA methylase
MGRVVCLSGTRRVLRCIGVELVPELCEIARQNAERMRFRQTQIEIRCGDCATTDLGDGTVYLLFNPFGPRTLRAVLDNIGVSLEKKMRPIRIAYSRPLEEAELAATEWLSKTAEFSTFFGNRVSFWSNQV